LNKGNLDYVLRNPVYIGKISHTGDVHEGEHKGIVEPAIFERVSRMLAANGKKNTIQLSMDVFNFSNLLNKDWGRRYFITNGNFPIVNFSGFQTGTRTPEYTLNANMIRGQEPWENNIIDNGFRSSRWQMQIGLRYIFGN